MFVNRILFCLLWCHIFCSISLFFVAGENSELNDQLSVKALVRQALELERNFFQSKEDNDLAQTYQRLLEQIERLEQENELEQDDRNALSHLQRILCFKVKDMKVDDVISLNVTSLAEDSRESILRENQQISAIDVSDPDLMNDLNKLQFGVYGNSILAKYKYVIDTFKMNYFPFAVDHLDKFELPMLFESYEDLNAIVNATARKLNKVDDSIDEINSDSWRIGASKNSLYRAGFNSAMYKWKNAENRDNIKKLFKGEKVIFLMDVTKMQTNLYNAFKFKAVDLVFRTPNNRTVNQELRKKLEAFAVRLNQYGPSVHRCNNNFYEISPTPKVVLFFSFEKKRDDSEVPSHRNMVYENLSENDAIFSPYAKWEIQLFEFDDNANFSELEQFAQHNINMELHATGHFIEEDVAICAKEDLLGKYYKRIHN